MRKFSEAAGRVRLNENEIPERREVLQQEDGYVCNDDCLDCRGHELKAPGL